MTVDDDAATDAALEDALSRVADPDAAEDDDTTSVDDTSSTEDEDAAASDSDDDTTADETDDESDDTDDVSAEGRSTSDFEDLLAKYGGDKEKMAKGVWEQARSVSKLYDEIQSLKELIANQRVTPEDEAKIIAEDPDVREVTDELASLQDELKETYSQQQGYIAAYGKQSNKIARLEGEYERADELARPEVSQKLSEARREMERIQNGYETAKKEYSRLIKDHKRLERQLKTAEVSARSKRDKAKQQELSTKAQADQTRVEFDSAYRAEAEKYGIEEGSKRFAVLRQSVKDRISSYLRSLPKDAPAIDIPRAVMALMGEYAEVSGLKARAAKQGAQKRKATGKTPTTTTVKPKGKVPTDKTGKYWDPNFARKRAKQLLG